MLDFRKMRIPLVALGLAAALASCTGVEEQRIRQLLNEKGFGTRAQGVATAENYIAGGDGVIFLVDPIVALQPGAEQLALLTQAQAVGLDGTILIPYVGPVRVLGLTAREVSKLVEEQLQTFFRFEVRVQARIIDRGKAFYLFGEFLGTRGRQVFPKPDFTVLEALGTYGTTNLANLGRVRVIRPDAENPLVVEVNFREMILTGNTTYNILLQENDIIYVPPTFFGALARFLEKLLSPLAVATRALFSAAALRTSYDVIFNDQLLFRGPIFF